jgi:large subunit ribosomal protein L35
MIDRQEKIAKIEQERGRLQRTRDTPAEQINGGEMAKERRITSIENYIEKLKILADINDPEIKRRFEDNQGTFFVLSSTKD